MKKKQYEVYAIELKAVDKEKFTLDAIFSTADEDRHGEIVAQNWELENFKKNPVVLNSHNYGDATEVIGKVLPETVAVKNGKLQGKILFAVEENPKAKIIFDLYAGKFMNAFSVGFMPLEFDKNFNILRSELLELSAVSVPANAMALAKAKGIEIEKLYGDETNDEPKDSDGEDAEEDGDDSEDGGEEVKPDGEEEVPGADGDADKKPEDTADGPTDEPTDDEVETEESPEDPEPEEKAVKKTTNEILQNFVDTENDRARKILIESKKILEEMLGGKEKIKADSQKRKLNKVIRNLIDAK